MIRRNIPCPTTRLTGLDRWILGEFAKLEAEVLAAYDQYEFHVVYQKLSQFIAVELSSVYHDVIKDRLYTDAANSPRRRSTQTALHRLVTGLCQMLAPILAFTADEAWEFVPGKPTGSVHESEFKPSNFSISEIEREDWKNLFALRDDVLPELEESTSSKSILANHLMQIRHNCMVEQVSLLASHLKVSKISLNRCANC